MSYRRTSSVTFRGKEVRNPILRKLVVLLLVVFGVIFFVIMLALSPILIVTHYALRASGRHGFVYREYVKDGRFSYTTHYSINVGKEGFRKV